MLTNGGGWTEKKHCERLNEIVFGAAAAKAGGFDPFTDDAEQPMLDGTELVQCHTPLLKLLPEYHDKFVLVAGIKDTIDVINGYGFKNAIHTEELAALIPALSPLTLKSLPESLMHDRKQAVLKRFGMTAPELTSKLQFDAIFMACDVFCYELNLQIFTDLIMSKEGRLGTRRTDFSEKQHVKLFLTNPDLEYADSYSLPRQSGQYPFLLALQSYLGAVFDGF